MVSSTTTNDDNSNCSTCDSINTEPMLLSAFAKRTKVWRGTNSRLVSLFLHRSFGEDTVIFVVYSDKGTCVYIYKYFCGGKAEGRVKSQPSYSVAIKYKIQRSTLYFSNDCSVQGNVAENRTAEFVIYFLVY